MTNDQPVWEEIAVAIRAYTDWPAGKSYPKSPNIGAWPFYLFLDCETRTDPSQRMRFGTYIWCQGTYEAEKGFFYDPEVLRPGEIQTLFRYAAQHGYEVCTKDEFVSGIFLGLAHALGARIVGFNLTFDLSRIVMPKVAPAKGRMRGGFSLTLRPERYIPKIRYRQIDRRLSFIEMTGVHRGRNSRSRRKKGKKSAPPRRGYFVDLKTLGGALLSGHFGLGSLAKALGIEAGKLKTEDHGRTLTPRYLKYAMRDAEVTAACFWKLKTRFEQMGLSSLTLETAYSEATVGKAHFAEMGNKPFLEVQPDFPKELLGHAMSSFYGGRSEVHIRRQISQVAYCDFLSMYPTVFVLMGLFRWVTANGVDWSDATNETRAFLATVTTEKMLAQPTWHDLTVLCQVELDDDIFPVRAPYGDQDEDPDNNTIGLNRAKSDCPLWYTLADCVVSTLLNGRPPRIVQAMRFAPREMQDCMRPMSLLQNSDYLIDPTRDDFFKRVIELRTATKARAVGADEQAASQLSAEEQFLKVLANSTGYGIFAQFISESLGSKAECVCYGPSGPGHKVNTGTRERPGKYFHPLLATFITGAARLMLALAESMAIEGGLDWAFCDTDSMAFVKPNGMADDKFFGRVQAIVDRFAALNPYDFGGSILKMESENFRNVDGQKVLHPLFVLPVSANRYCAFNIENGFPVIRKASTHGVGQYLAPYKDEDAPGTIPPPLYELKGVDRWEHDLWWTLAKAAIDGDIDNADLDALPGFNKPAACQFTASSYDRWKWFDKYNALQPPKLHVGPGNFLLTFQLRKTELSVRLVARHKKRSSRPKAVHPVAPYDKDPARAAQRAFDRETNEPVPVSRLATYADVFREYPRHAEAKFQNAGALDKGITERRRVHIRARNIILIGKESNEYDEEEVELDAEATASFGGIPDELQAQQSLLDAIDRFGVATLAGQAGVARQTVWAARTGKAKPTHKTSRKLKRAGRALQAERQIADVELAQFVQQLLGAGGISLRDLARQLSTDASNFAKAIAGQRRFPVRVRIKLCTLLGICQA